MAQCTRSGSLKYYLLRFRRGLLVATGAAVLAGCASIQHFSVSPRTACNGDTVIAEWSAAGQVRLTATPPLQGTDIQVEHGEKAFVVKQSTHFVLTARRLFGSKSAEADVEVAPREHSYGAVATCNAQTRLISTDLTLDHQLSSNFSVATVSNPLNRNLRVDKAGKTQVLTPHGHSDAFRGDPTQGTWRLASPLGSGESCDTAMRSIRQRLQMQLELICGR